MSGTVTGTPITIAELAERIADQIGANNIPLQPVSVSVDTTITAALHAGKLLKLLTGNIVLTAGTWANLGDGFNCVFVNLSGGNVIMAGMTNVNGHSRIAPGASGGIIAAAGQSGNEVRWFADASLL